MNAQKHNTAITTAILEAPSVREADANQHVPSTLAAVTVVIPYWNTMAVGDRIDLLWDGDVTGTYTDYVPVTTAMVRDKISPTFSVSASEIVTNHEAAISYVVTPAAGGDKESSVVYTLSIGEAQFLPAPSVPEASGTSISVEDNPDGVTVVVPADAGLEVGDVVTVYWTGTIGAGTTSITETVSGTGAGEALMFHISVDVLTADAGTGVRIYYVVEKASGSIGTSAEVSYEISGAGPAPSLPAPYVAEADNDKMTITPSSVMSGASVVIPATAKLAPGDSVTVSLQDKNNITTSSTHTVREAEAGKTLTLVLDVALDNEENGDLVSVWYTVTLSGTDTPDKSDITTYTVNGVVDKGKLKVMGARAMHDYASRANIQTLVALNADTLELMNATWQYDGDTESTTTRYFRDTTPERLLHVRSGEYEVTLNIPNVTLGKAVIVARLDSGAVVAWGDEDSGGSVPSDIAGLTDIVSVMGGGNAAAALRSNGSVVAWGDEDFGGSVPSDIAGLTDIVSVSATLTAFAALRSNGSVVAWGYTEDGSDVPSDIAGLTDIVSVSATLAAFAALRSNGSVVAWGNVANGGSVPSGIAALTDIVSVAGAGGAGRSFAALRSNGSVVTWPNSSTDTLLPDVSGLPYYRAVYAAYGTFAGLTDDSQLAIWGKYSGSAEGISYEYQAVRANP